MSTGVMRFLRLSQRGFTLPELMLTVAVAGTIMAIAVPVMTDVSDSAKLGSATRELEREFQSARLKSVSSNRILRVRLNCPAAGYYRTVELVGTATVDNATNRCLQSAYPGGDADNDVMTRPNYDGPIRTMPLGATVGDEVLEFHPDGTARTVVSNVSTAITSPITVTVTRKSKTKSITINAAGKIQLQH
jgi:prepilin-type N-terminal cleavage/methylation domain-containing protein